MCFYTLFNATSAGFIVGRIVSCSCLCSFASFKENFSDKVRSRLRQGQRLSATRSETICDKVRRRLRRGQRPSLSAQLGRRRVLQEKWADTSPNGLESQCLSGFRVVRCCFITSPETSPETPPKPPPKPSPPTLPRVRVNLKFARRRKWEFEIPVSLQPNFKFG